MENESQYLPQNIPYNFNNESIQKGGNKILKPIRQEKIVKVPVTQYVEKIVEKEQIKYVNKYVDVVKPIITYKTKHIPKPIYLDKIKYKPSIVEKEKIIHVPKIEYKNKIIETPIYIHREKIIEKKIPLVIERVIPVLKVNKIEKEVLTNIVDCPEISVADTTEMNKEVLKNSSEKININIINVNNKRKEREEEVEGEEETQHIEQQYIAPPTRVIDSGVQGHSSEAYVVKNMKLGNGSVSSDGDSYKETLEHKNETMYQDEITYGHNVDTLTSSEEKANNEENNSNENIKRSMEEHYYSVDEAGNKINTTHVSIHVPATGGISHNSIHNSYVHSFDNNNVSINHILDNEATSNRYTGENINTMFNEQMFQESCNTSPNNLTVPIGMNNVESYNTIRKDNMEMKHSYMNPSNMNISCESYIAKSQNEYKKQPIPRKMSFTPSYVNGNGQSFVTVRPATIVEYRPKPKGKLSICNFMNRCCGSK